MVALLCGCRSGLVESVDEGDNSRWGRDCEIDGGDEIRVGIFVNFVCSQSSTSNIRLGLVSTSRK